MSRRFTWEESRHQRRSRDGTGSSCTTCNRWNVVLTQDGTPHRFNLVKTSRGVINRLPRDILYLAWAQRKRSAWDANMRCRQVCKSWYRTLWFRESMYARTEPNRFWTSHKEGTSSGRRSQTSSTRASRRQAWNQVFCWVPARMLASHWAHSSANPERVFSNLWKPRSPRTHWPLKVRVTSVGTTAQRDQSEKVRCQNPPADKAGQVHPRQEQSKSHTHAQGSPAASMAWTTESRECIWSSGSPSTATNEPTGKGRGNLKTCQVSRRASMAKSAATGLWVGNGASDKTSDDSNAGHRDGETKTWSITVPVDELAVQQVAALEVLTEWNPWSTRCIKAGESCNAVLKSPPSTTWPQRRQSPINNTGQQVLTGISILHMSIAR